MVDTEEAASAAPSNSTAPQAQALPAQQNITVTNRHLNITPFVIDRDPTNTANRWDKWKKDIERQFRFFGIHEPELKKDGLIIYGGRDIADLEDSLPEVESTDPPADEYTKFIRKLDKHFLPKKNKDYARFQLGNLQQEEDESLAKYFARVREIAKKCEYHDENDAIRDHLIKTMRNRRIRVKAIRQGWTLQEILDEAAIDEETNQQATEMEKKIPHEEKDVKRVEENPPSKPCGRCGRKHTQKCPAFGATCTACGKRNHYANVCRSKPQEKKGYRPQQDKPRYPKDPRTRRDQRGGRNFRRPNKRNGKVHQVSGHEEIDRKSDSSDTSGDECFIHHLKIHKATSQGIQKTCTIFINGIETTVEPDTGADTNIMDEHQFRKLQTERPEMTLQESTIKLKALNHDLPIMGECTVKLENQTRVITAAIVVVKGKIDSLPLLGRPSLDELGMLKIDETGGLKEPNKAVKKIENKNPELEKILDRYKNLFHGVGKATRNGQEIQIHLPMKEDAIPIAQKPRRVPFHLIEPLQDRIEEFIAKDIMEKVPDHEAITWCSPIVVQPKPKNPKDIRVSLDLHLLNKSMLRTRNVQAPITEDFVTEFRDCKVFSKLDLNHGYHQFCLDPESRKTMTFSTPWGNYRYKRLAFGGVNSQDLFDAEISKVISGTPKALNNRDDIMIGGRDWDEHNKCLAQLLQRLEDHNLTLRREKCEFGKASIDFHGHLFTQEGLKPSPTKIQAVQNCAPPASKEELVSFLQMVAYLSRYISNFSSRCEPLRKLTKVNAKFEWSTEQEKAFKDLKAAITAAPVLIPYHPERETLIICDGSPAGLGGGLFQKTGKGFQPVHYVSRTLTDTEKRYSQIEREALAAEFTTTRLQMYLLGAPKFKLATDHKPLLPLMNNPTAKLPPRIERLALKMQNLDFEMIHIPGKTNMTDYMSRHPLPETGTDRLEKYVIATVQTEHAVVLDKIKEETAKDRELTKLAAAMKTGKWTKTDPDLKPYFDLRAELYMAEGLILRTNRIIPPESLRDRIIQIAHKQGHLGISKTKEMLRRKYWFPIMNSRIDTVVSTCFDCQIATNTQHTEPAKMTKLPERPWETVEIDFCGPFPSKEYALVITDQYSRYPEVEFVYSTAIKPVRKKLKKVFATHGVPKTVQSDNGPPFNSEDFKEFAAEMGFTHKKVTPRHPKAQGQVESFNKLMNKTAAIARAEGIDLHEATYDMLQAYRETPHPATGTAPYEILMNRAIRTRLDHYPTERASRDEAVRKRDSKYKEKLKSYHDQRHRAKEHKFKAGEAVLLKRDKKRKGDTPFEPYIYIATKVIGSTIHARRVSDGKTVCRDASKFKLLRTTYIPARDKQRKPPTARPVVPPAAKYQATPAATQETTPVAAPIATRGIVTQLVPMEATPTNQTPPLRRSHRQTKSTFDGHLKDYTT